MKTGLYDKSTREAVTVHSLLSLITTAAVISLLPPSVYLFFKELDRPHDWIYWLSGSIFVVWLVCLLKFHKSIQQAFVYTQYKYEEKLHKANTKYNIELHEMILLLRLCAITSLTAYLMGMFMEMDPITCGQIYILAKIFMFMDTVYLVGTNLIVRRPIW